MSDESNPMDKFNFLIGRWKLEYKIPKSQFSDEETAEGEGEFKSILNDQFVAFEYHAEFSKGKVAAHGIFAWDKKSKTYKYWWFEDSGEFNEAACNFIDDSTLCMNWYNSLFVQAFYQVEKEKVILELRYPLDKSDYKIVLEVALTKI